MDTEYTYEEWIRGHVEHDRARREPPPAAPRTCYSGCGSFPPPVYEHSIFRCSVCGRWVCSCTGGLADRFDPNGDMCSDCWNSIRRSKHKGRFLWELTPEDRSAIVAHCFPE